MKHPLRFTLDVVFDALADALLGSIYKHRDRERDLLEAERRISPVAGLTERAVLALEAIAREVRERREIDRAVHRNQWVAAFWYCQCKDGYGVALGPTQRPAMLQRCDACGADRPAYASPPPRAEIVEDAPPLSDDEARRLWVYAFDMTTEPTPDQIESLRSAVRRLAEIRGGGARG